MSGKIWRFVVDKCGAITADYVVLAGAIIALGLAATNAIQMGTFEASNEISEAVKSTGCVVTGDSGTTDLTNCN